MAKAKTKPRKKAARRPAKNPAPPSLSPDIELFDPESTKYNRGLIWIQRQSGIRIDEYTMLTLGACFACVRAIAETIAWLPWQEFEKVGEKRVRRQDNVDWLIGTQSSPEMAAFQFRETILAHALTWGNGYAEIERDGAGRPFWLWLITPDRVCVERNARDDIFYRVKNQQGEEDTILPAEDVYHLRGIGFDGLVGYNLARLAALSISIGIGLDQASGSYFENDSTPGGILTHPGRLSPQAQDQLRKTWQGKHGGSRNRRTVAILEEGMTWVQTASPPEQSQMVEQRQLTPAEICRWFRVPPHKIADLARSTFANIEQQSIEFVTDCLMPWVRRLETEADIKLFGRTNRGRVFTRINVNALLRGDSAARSAFYNAMLDRGVFSVNEVREKEDLDTIGPDGDKRFVPLNMQLLEKAGEEPPPAKPTPPGMPPANPDAPPKDEPPANGQAKQSPDPMAHLRPVVVEVCDRIARREKARGDLAGKMDADKLATWLPAFLDEHEEYCVRELRAVFQGLATAAEVPIDFAEKLLFVSASLHKDRLAAKPPAAWGAEPDLTPDALFVPFKGGYGRVAGKSEAAGV